MCNAWLEMGTSKEASREITEETSRAIYREAHKATTQAAGKVAIKGGRALVATGNAFRTHLIDATWVTWVPDVASIKFLRSAVGGKKVVGSLVKNVESAEVYARERRRQSEIESAGDSIVVRERKRPVKSPPAK